MPTHSPRTCTCLSPQAAKAKLDPLDCWRINMHLPSQGLVSPMPHCISLVQDEVQPGQDHANCSGMFWNYLSVRV